MDIKRIGVVGSGQMGSGITQLFASHDFSVIMHDIDESFLNRGMDAIKNSLDRLVSKEKIGESKRDEILGRISTTLSLDDMAKCDFVIEAASENENIKLDIFKKLSEVTRSDCVLATNTTSISITKLAAATAQPNKVIGVHFMNPPTVLKGVEIIIGLQTSQDTENISKKLVESLGKTAFTAKDSPGFISSRLIISMVNEAIFVLQEGVGGAEAIDKCMVASFNHPMGPLALADLIGLDTVLAALETMHSKLGDQRYRPCPLLRKYVDAGWLGRKTGRGFYEYNK